MTQIQVRADRDRILDPSSAGPSDCRITLEAIPAPNGKGLSLGYGVHDSPFGPCLVATTAQGICNLHFLDVSDIDRESAAALLGLEWPGATVVHDPSGTAAWMTDLWMTGGDRPAIALAVRGTAFQLQVWRALLSIPSGGLTTYQRLATAIGRPTAARAVGNAVGRNPVAYLIPCHRVVRESGAWGGYRWGPTRKAALLAWEAAQGVT